MITVTAEQDYGIINIKASNHLVLAFARYSESEIAIVATNFNNERVRIHLNLKALKFIFTNPRSYNQIFKKIDLLTGKEDKYLYTAESLIQERHYHEIPAY